MKRAGKISVITLIGAGVLVSATFLGAQGSCPCQ